MTSLITRDTFQRMLDDIIVISDKLNDGWETVKTSGLRYLSKKTVQRINKTSTADDKIAAIANLTCGTIDDHEDDESCLTDQSQFSSDTIDIYTFDYNIVFSESYSVPVLYFNVYTSSGSLLPLDKVWDLVPEYYRSRLEEDRWTFLTQVEHPYLGRPFYQLHPCHTDKLLSSVAQIGCNTESNINNYLISWLCAVGPVVRLEIPMEYGLGVNKLE